MIGINIIYVAVRARSVTMRHYSSAAPTFRVYTLANASVTRVTQDRCCSNKLKAHTAHATNKPIKQLLQILECTSVPRRPC